MCVHVCVCVYVCVCLCAYYACAGNASLHAFMSKNTSTCMPEQHCVTIQCYDETIRL